MSLSFFTFLEICILKVGNVLILQNIEVPIIQWKSVTTILKVK